MNKRLLVLATAAVLALPGMLSAQGFGIAGRAGTLGIGAEGALGLNESFVIRGGLGLMPFEPSLELEGIDYTVKLPETWFNIGADLYLGSGFRIGGGMLFKSDSPSLEGMLTQTENIGGRDFTPEEIGTIVGTLESKDRAPYALIGFGNHIASGVGLFIDFGVAFLGDTQILLENQGGTFPDQGEIQSRLDQEAVSIDEEIPSWAKDLWPILNIGITVGIN